MSYLYVLKVNSYQIYDLQILFYQIVHCLIIFCWFCCCAEVFNLRHFHLSIYASGGKSKKFFAKTNVKEFNPYAFS